MKNLVERCHIGGQWFFLEGTLDSDNYFCRHVANNYLWRSQYNGNWVPIIELSNQLYTLDK